MCRAAKGVGVKTAAQLINEYGDLDTLLARAGEIKQPKRREALTDPQSVELILISKKLVELVRDVAVETPLEDLALHEPDAKKLIAFLQAMEFTTITRRVAELYGVDLGQIQADPEFVGPGGWRGRNGETTERAADAPSLSLPQTQNETAQTPEMLADARAKASARDARRPKQI